MMKKILAAILIVLSLAVPVSAAQKFYVWVNGVKLDANAVNISGRIYVPVRAVAEVLGAEVSWDGTNAKVKSVIRRPVIEGDKTFVDKINEALDLLYEKDPAHYAMVCQNTRKIFVDEKINTTRIAETNGEDVGFSSHYVKDKDRFVKEYIVGTLVHEASHNAFFRTQVFLFDTKKDETIAYTHSITAMELAGAPQWMIDERERALEKYK